MNNTVGIPVRLVIVFLVGFLVGGCFTQPATNTTTPSPSQQISTFEPSVTQELTRPVLTPDNPAPESYPVLVGAGDIADCGSEGDEATASLLDNITGTVFTTGDNVYDDGTKSEFLECYHPSWGRHKARTYPAPGNHDYHTENAAGYFEYFGPVAGWPAKGYYSYDLGTWHIVVLNSNIPVRAGSPQEQWLRADLAAHPVSCTLAYWHHPRFSSGSRHGSDAKMQPLWQALYDYGVDVVLGGHEHNYERFAPQDPQGVADPDRGIRQFVIGSGGKSHYSFGPAISNSEVRNADTYGVLKLVLLPDSYEWEFIPEEGKHFTDSGSGPCVGTGSSEGFEVLTFTPIDDATIRSESPDRNYGSEGSLQVDNRPVDNFLIKFDLTGIGDRYVLSAKLRLFNINDSDTGGDLYVVTENTWQEEDVTWSTAPQAGQHLLASIGPVAKNSWVEVDITSLILGDGIYSLRLSTSASDGADYASKEYGPGSIPRLVVTVSDASGQAP